jgi:hypothetical protein
MKLTKTVTTLLSGLTLVLVASAVTPTPSPKTQSTPANAPSPAIRGTPADTPHLTAKPTPAIPVKEDLAIPSEQPTASVPPRTILSATPPNPVLYLLSVTPYTANGKNWMRYRYDVFNKTAYPAEMFAAAPTLPPCGSNTNSSRTWVDFFDSTGKRLYGFCALGNPDDLGKIWFALEEGVIPPSYVYIELNDRKTNTKYKSNLADTTL